MKDTKVKIYLDTSVPSAYYDNEKQERQESTKEFWLKTKNCQGNISELVKQELGQIEDETLKKKMLKLVEDFNVLKITDDVKKLANEYIKEGIIPNRFISDAIHIAVATVNGIDVLISWNFKHLVNLKTRQMVNLVNVRSGYKQIQIIAPPEL